MKKTTDYDPWYFDAETGEIKRARDLELSLKKTASVFKKSDGIPEPVNLDEEGQDEELNVDTDGIEGPMSDAEYLSDDYDLTPTGEVLIEDGYLVMFTEWGWEEVIDNKGYEVMAEDYEQFAQEFNCVHNVTSDMANSLTDLLFNNELDAENFVDGVTKNWGIGRQLINVIPVSLVPEDPRLGETEIVDMSFGEYLGKIRLTNGEPYFIFRNMFAV